jgi:hypothetical protein
MKHARLKATTTGVSFSQTQTAQLSSNVCEQKIHYPFLMRHMRISKNYD